MGAPSAPLTFFRELETQAHSTLNHRERFAESIAAVTDEFASRNILSLLAARTGASLLCWLSPGPHPANHRRSRRPFEMGAIAEAPAEAHLADG